MAKGQGGVFRPEIKRPNGEYQQTKIWHLRYSIGGKPYRESSGTTSRDEALRLLSERIGNRKSGKLMGSPDRVRLAEYEKGDDGIEKLVGGLRAIAEKQYDLDGLRSKKRAQQCWNRLEEFFGAGTRVVDINPLRLKDYAAARLKEGAKPQTINNELSQLRRGFNLAVKDGILAVKPPFTLLKVKNRRTGFFEESEFAALMVELPPDGRDVIQFLKETGWRKNEGRLLRWTDVDMDGGVIRLEGARSKSGEPRIFPFSSAPPLKALLEKRYEQRNGLYVFQRDGEPTGESALRYAWEHATKRAGLAGRLIHDLRRTVARDMRRKGLSEGDIMRLCGWETRSTFDRYNIISEADLAAAVAKRYQPEPHASQQA